VVEAVKASMMRAIDSAIQVTETMDQQFVANIQYKVGLSRSLHWHSSVRLPFSFLLCLILFIFDFSSCEVRYVS